MLRYPQDVYRLSIPDLEKELLKRKVYFSQLKIIGLPQMFFGVICITGGIESWKQTGQILSFRLVFGSILFLCFLVVLFIEFRLIRQMKLLKQHLFKRTGKQY